MLGWMLATAEADGVTERELVAMLEDVVGMRAAAKRGH
jgi:hypothetical protein